MNKELSIETPLTKTFSWTEPLDCFSEKEFKHNWKNVADHIRYTLMEDLINPTDYGKINIDAEKLAEMIQNNIKDLIQSRA